jgi:hypothetical protein
MGIRGTLPGLTPLSYVLRKENKGCMIDPETSKKVMEISSAILEIAEEYHEGGGFPRGDYQGLIEAQVINAIQYGVTRKAL